VSSTYNRRQFLAHSAATAGGVVAAGALVDQLGGATPAGAVTKGGTLVVGVIAEQNQPFVPDYATMDLSGFLYARSVYDPLCVTSANGKTVYPYLCESIKANASYDEWTITAREGVKFHDGTPCDGDAIYANLVADYESELTGKAIQGLIKGFTHKTGSNTVVVNTTYKWVTFPYTLAEQQIGFMAQPDTLGSGSTPPSKGTNPVGTGPFIFDSWDYNSEFVTVRNPSYWRSPVGTFPYLNELVFTPIPDSGTRVSNLADGSVDIIVETDPPTVKTLASTLGSGFTVENDLKTPPVYTPSVGCIMMNVRNAPFNNKDMRYGCAAAINRALFVATIDMGESVAVNGIYLPKTPYYKNPSYPAYSKSAAQSYINKVPSADRKFDLQYVTGDPTILYGAEFVQNALMEVGVTVTLVPVSQPELIGAAVSHQFQAMTWAQFGGLSADLNYPWFSTASGGLNFAGNFDNKIQSDMLAGMAATSATAREKAWGAVNNQIDIDLPYLWLDRSVIAVAASNKVQNWKTYTDPSGQAVIQPNQGVMFFTETWKS
jgi:peptide/nickel transport system substrate-binding protein